MGYGLIKKSKKYIWLFFMVAILAIMPLLWYSAPSVIRVVCYKKFSPGVYKRIIEDNQFDISAGEVSKTYDFNNEYAIPVVIEWHIIQNNGADIPADPTRCQLYELKIKAELLIDNEVVSTVTNSKDIPLGYSKNLRTGQEYRYFPLLYCDFPASGKFSSNCQLRITVLKTDPKLKGLKGVLVVKPNTTL
ncbi:MAG TPA: hypothetical protein PLX18_12575 [Anaerohalosphaeraceae bacterium]|nr:hypothetical protein [Anaerohalosphaeraceae bacterium]HQI08679.1 hypothetical protein [Anaerohalosphaeraceae bacterium]HQJ69027.1 hypothetical protein [Anaerohalosphaeraceae bacterium]